MKKNLCYFTGSQEERGIISWRKHQLASSSVDKKQSLSVYEYPHVTKYIRRVKCCSYVPVSPSFSKEVIIKCPCSSVKNRNNINGVVHVNQVAIDDVELEEQTAK